MQKGKRIISTIIAICFIFNTAVTDLALSQPIDYSPNTAKLATASQFDDILNDLQRYDMGRIHGALLLNIAEWLKRDISTLKDLTIEGKKISVVNPTDMKFFINERTPLHDGRLISIRCTIKDKRGPRTYYAIFPTSQNKISEIPVGIYTEEAYKKSEAFTKGLPRRSPEDAEAIGRYAEHEKEIDTFLAKKIKDGESIVCDPIEMETLMAICGFKKELSQFGLKNIDDIIEDMTRRKLILIHAEKMELPIIRMRDESGKWRNVRVEAHSSNNAIWIPLGLKEWREFHDMRDSFKILTQYYKDLATGIISGLDRRNPPSKVGPDSRKRLISSFASDLIPGTERSGFEKAWDDVMKKSYAFRLRFSILLFKEVGPICGLRAVVIDRYYGYPDNAIYDVYNIFNDLTELYYLRFIASYYTKNAPRIKELEERVRDIKPVDLDKSLLTRDYEARGDIPGRRLRTSGGIVEETLKRPAKQESARKAEPKSAKKKLDKGSERALLIFGKNSRIFFNQEGFDHKDHKRYTDEVGEISELIRQKDRDALVKEGYLEIVGRDLYRLTPRGILEILYLLYTESHSERLGEVVGWDYSLKEIRDSAIGDEYKHSLRGLDEMKIYCIRQWAPPYDYGSIRIRYNKLGVKATKVYKEAKEQAEKIPVVVDFVHEKAGAPWVKQSTAFESNSLDIALYRMAVEKEEGQDKRAKSSTHTSKNPEDLLKLIAVEDAAGEILSAPKLLVWYEGHQEVLGFEKPAKIRDSSLKTVERDLYDSKNSLLEQGLVQPLLDLTLPASPTNPRKQWKRGEDREYLFEMTEKGRKAVTQVKMPAPIVAKQIYERIIRLIGTAAMDETSKKRLRIVFPPGLDEGVEDERYNEMIADRNAGIEDARKSIKEKIEKIRDSKVLEEVADILQKLVESKERAQARYRLSDFAITHIHFAIDLVRDRISALAKAPEAESRTHRGKSPAESGKSMEEPPVAGTWEKVPLSYLVPHPLINALIGMIIDYSRSEEGLKDSDKFVDYKFPYHYDYNDKPEYEIYWFGNSTEGNTSFLDVFNKLAKVHAIRNGRTNVTFDDKVAISQDMVKKAGLKDILIDKAFVEDLEARLRLQIEHFGVEPGTIYAMSGYSNYRDEILRHVNLERNIHGFIMRELFPGNIDGYRLWRKDGSTRLLPNDITFKYEDLDSGSLLGIIEIKTGNFTYNDFAEEAQRIAEEYHPLSKIIGTTIPSMPKASGEIYGTTEVPTAGAASPDETGGKALRHDDFEGIVAAIERNKAGYSAVINNKERLWLFDPDGNIIFKDLDVKDGFSLTETHLATCDSRHLLTLRDIKTREILFPDRDINASRGFSLTETHLATRDSQARLTLRDIKTRKILFPDRDIDTRGSFMPFTLTENYLATSYRNHLTLIDIMSAKNVFTYLDASRGVTFTETHLATRDSNGLVTLGDIKTREIIFKDLKAWGGFALTKTHLATSTLEGLLTLRDIKTREILFPGQDIDARGSFELTETHLATCDSKGLLTLRDIKTGEIIFKDLDIKYDSLYKIFGHNFALTKTHLATRDSNGLLTLRDIKTREIILQDIDARGSFRLTERYLTIRDSKGLLTLIDINKRKVIFQNLDASGGFTLTETHLATRGSEGPLPLRDINTGEVITAENLKAHLLSKAESGKSMEEPPVAATWEKVPVSHLAPHPLVNALVGMIIDYSRSEEGLKKLNQFVAYDQQAHIYWLGDRYDGNNKSFLDVFNKLAAAQAKRSGRETSTVEDKIAVAEEMVRRAGLEDIIKNVDAAFVKDLEGRLRLQIEHFAVERGTTYAMRGYEILRNEILYHTRLERAIHLAIIKDLFNGNIDDYRYWRIHGNKLSMRTDLTASYNNTTIKIKATVLTYKEFAQKAHQLAERYAPLSGKIKARRFRGDTPISEERYGSVEPPTAGAASPDAEWQREDEIEKRLKEILVGLRDIFTKHPDLLERPLRVGAFVETKPVETRAGIIPYVIHALSLIRIESVVEKGIGIAGERKGARFENSEYEEAGARMVDTQKEALEEADIIQHIKELQPAERELLAETVAKFGRKIMFNFNHFAQSRKRLEDVETGATFVSFENIIAEGRKPMLEGPSEKAGINAAYQMAFHLLSQDKIDGKILRKIEAALAEYDKTNEAPIPDINLSGKKVTVYGGGVVGYNQARMLAKMKASVTVIEKNEARRLWLAGKFQEEGLEVAVIDSADTVSVENTLTDANGISTTAYTQGMRAQHLISKELLNRIGTDKVFTVVDIDQGGGVEGVRPTTHDNPTYLQGGNLFYCVPNIPASVPRQTSIDISLAAAKYLIVIALYGLEKAVEIYPELGYAVDAADGRITNPIIEEQFAETEIEPTIKMETNPLKETPLETALSIARARVDANIAGAEEISTAEGERCNVLLPAAFFVNGEQLKAHQGEYGDRFELQMISGQNTEQFFENILAKARGKEKRTVALIPKDYLSDERLKELAKLGIRFISTTEKELNKAMGDSYREKFQRDTYATLPLVRSITKDTPKDSHLYRALSFYLRTHFAFTLAEGEKLTVEDYINAIVTSDTDPEKIAILVKGCFLYRPTEKYAIPAYEQVAATLLSA